MMSELATAVEATRQCMDRYDNYAACQILNDLVEGLSNWFVRRVGLVFGLRTSVRQTNWMPIGRSMNP